MRALHQSFRSRSDSTPKNRRATTEKFGRLPDPFDDDPEAFRLEDGVGEGVACHRC